MILAMLMLMTPPSVPAIYVEERVEVARAGGPFEVVGTNKTWIAADRVRVEMGSAVQIYDATAAGSFTAIDERAKSYYQVPAEALRRSDMVAPASMTGMAVDQEGSPTVPAQVFRKVKRTETVGGWKNAQVWEATEPDVLGAKATLWMAPGLAAEWTALQTIVRRVFGGAESPHDDWFAQAAKLEGWPVRVERITATRRIRTETTRIEKITVPASLFSAPGAGYELVSDPSGFTHAAKPTKSKGTSK